MCSKLYALSGRLAQLTAEHDTCWLCRRKMTKKFVVEYSRLTRQRKLLSSSAAREAKVMITEEAWEQLRGHCRVCCRVCAYTMVKFSNFFDLEVFLNRWSRSDKYQLSTIKSYINSLSELDAQLYKAQLDTETLRICKTNLWELFNYVPVEYTSPRYRTALSVYKELMFDTGPEYGS